MSPTILCRLCGIDVPSELRTSLRVSKRRHPKEFPSSTVVAGALHFQSNHNMRSGTLVFLSVFIALAAAWSVEDLRELYTATGGPNWYVKTGWSDASNTNFCGWSGVTCDANGQLQQVSFINNNLVGQVPTAWTNTSTLQTVIFTANHLTGTLDLSLASGMTTLYSCCNQLTNVIFNEGGAVQYIDLSYNLITHIQTPPGIIYSLVLNYNPLVQYGPRQPVSDLELIGLTSTSFTLLGEEGAGFYTKVVISECPNLVSLSLAPDAGKSALNAESIFIENNPILTSIDWCSYTAVKSGCGVYINTDVNIRNNPLLTSFAATLYGNIGGALNLTGNSFPAVPSFPGGFGVSRLDLSYNNISAAIYPGFYQSTSLTWVSLAHNFLTSDVRDITSMTALTYIDFSYNLISYVQPMIGSQNANLKYVNLEGNRLSYLPNFVNAWSLIFGGTVNMKNNLIQSIPTEDLNNIIKITYLLLDDNHITSLPDLSALNAVDTLSLSGNQIQSIQSLSAMSTLRSLDLSRNKLTTFDPSLFPSTLFTLDISGNQIGGALPDISSMTNLTTLNIANNKFNQWPADGFPSNAHLSNFVCSHNAFNSIPPINNPQLQSIEFNSNNISSFVNVTGLSTLTRIDLGNNVIDAVPAELFQSTSLTFLNLSQNLLTGPMPDVQNMVSLVTLDMSHNNLSGDIPDIEAITGLVYLDLSHNLLSGWASTIGWGKVYNLVTLKISHNRLSTVPDPPLDFAKVSLAYVDISYQYDPAVGKTLISVPYYWCLLPNMTYVDASHNNVDYIAKYDGPSMVYLDFSYNERITTVLETACNGINLIHCDISHCNITSNIPLFGAKVQYIDMSHNHFTADGVSGNFHLLMTLNNIVHLDFSNNNMTSDVPALTPHSNWRYIDMSVNQLGVNYGLDPSFSLLSSVLYFNASYNTLLGSIPGFGENTGTPSMLYLDLSHNLFSVLKDPIAMSNLIHYDMSHNMFVQSMQYNIFFCTKLQFIDVSHNNLSGSTPDISLMKNIQHVDLSSNGFAGPLLSVYGTAATLTFLNVSSSDNKYVDALPNGLGNSNLQVLDLSYNQFLSSTPVFVAGNRLTYLGLTHNQFFSNSAALDSLQYVKGITRLDLSHNGLTFLTDSLAQLPLTYLDLSYNSLADAWRPSYYSLTGLTYLNVANNLITGSLSSSLSQLTRLTYLNLAKNQLSGGLPDVWSQIPGVTYLDISQNQFQGPVPSSVSSLNKITYLDLSNNNFISTMPALTTNMNGLTFFDVSRNQLEGQIPDMFGNNKALTSIRLYNNTFQGKLPDSIQNINVKSIYASNNQLSNFNAVGLQSLTTLDLSYNQITSDVSNFVTLYNLTTLSLGHNSISGSLTGSISDLKSLRSLDLSYNKLSGSIPSSLSNMNLSTLRLNDNAFTTVNIDSLPSLSLCDIGNNNLVCPISKWVYINCNTRCQVTETVGVLVEWTVTLNMDSYSSVAVTNLIADVLKIDPKRIAMQNSTAPVQKRAISYNLVFVISPALVNYEMTAQQAFDSLRALNSTQLASYGITGAGTPVGADASSGSSQVVEKKLSSGQIGGIAVGVIIFVALVVVALFFVARLRTRTITNQLDLIDMSNINLGAAKRSVVDYDELKDKVMIGQGAFGIVYKATWRNMTVALKQIRAEYVTEAQVRDFLHEVQIVQNLRGHPNVVLFLGITFPPQPLSLLTEYCGGGSLHSYLNRSEAVPESQKFYFIQKIALGMLHLHEEKIIHRDLAVRNILLSEHMEPKVSDFGMSRETVDKDSAQQTQSNVGPIKWMSPEAIRDREYSVKSDSFSFGVVIWEILTCQEPWGDMTPIEVAFAVINEGKRLDIPKDCHPALSELMQQCWSSQPEDRPDFLQITDYLNSAFGVKEIDDVEVIEDAQPQSNYSAFSAAGEQYHSVGVPATSGYRPPNVSETPETGSAMYANSSKMGLENV
ncbi:putative receptor protein kinase [Planoprotostelium fungivorum]|uniref:Putative receptor protein kinase n=1 Tax=Planoprotostelium fungivorum TaxID=1890364 RepID=A0A2P6NCT6_9EUKA|nr:putative receptor protein kinase [Planoprotostelium fungivorum]